MPTSLHDLSKMTFSVKLYPDLEGNTPVPQTQLGACFSGGGSRALSCALGQLSALKAMSDPVNPKKSLLDRVAFISSVSGGSWASVPFTYLPTEVSRDSEFLISPCPPSELIKKEGGPEIPCNVSYLNPLCLGTVPGNFTFEKIILYLIDWYSLKLKYDIADSYFWITAIGHFILKQFNLFDVKYSKLLEPDKFYSSSSDYIKKNIIPNNSTLSVSDFYTTHDDRPTLIVNYNLIEDIKGAPQIPVQATPISTGLRGQSPDGTIKGGGVCESFGFGSTLVDTFSPMASVSFDRRFSLCDITGCSSAFFAQWLQQYMAENIELIRNELQERQEHYGLTRERVSSIQAEMEESLVRTNKQLSSSQSIVGIVPQYNYWPVSPDEQNNKNKIQGFSDGGTFDNTGLLGLIARTTGDIKAIAFINCEKPLSLDSAHDNILVVDDQLPLLFGRQGYDATNGRYPSWGGMKSSHPMSYVQIFEDSQNQFCDLLTDLKTSSQNGGGSLGYGTAWSLQSLVTVDNPVAAISSGRRVDVLWIYNNRVDTWQVQITDLNLIADLAAGQGSHPSGPLQNFPNFSTAAQLCLGAEEVNMLAQLSAWNLQNLSSQLEKLLSS